MREWHQQSSQIRGLLLSMSLTKTIWRPSKGTGALAGAVGGHTLSSKDIKMTFPASFPSWQWLGKCPGLFLVEWSAFLLFLIVSSYQLTSFSSLCIYRHTLILLHFTFMFFWYFFFKWKVCATLCQESLSVAIFSNICSHHVSVLHFGCSQYFEHFHYYCICYTDWWSVIVTPWKLRWWLACVSKKLLLD